MCQLEAHRRVHEKILDHKKYKCEHCDYATTDNFRLRVHLKKQHGMEDEEAQDEIKNKKKPIQSNMTRLSCVRSEGLNHSFEL